MKMKILCFILALVFTLTACSKTDRALDGSYKIVIVTGDETTQSNEAIRGVNDLIRRYGDANIDKKGLIKHVQYSKAAMKSPDLLSNKIVSIAEDLSVKAIVVNKALKGTVAAFTQIREIRPDIVLLAAEPEEQANDIQAVADAVASQDFVSRGVTIVWAARKLAADRFVYLSFPRHLENKNLNLQRQVMKEACEDLGLTFEAKMIRDPIYADSQYLDVYIRSLIKAELAKNGDKLAFFCTDDTYSAPIITELLESNGGIFVEAASPSPINGYAEALGADVDEKSNFQAIIEKFDITMEKRIAANRFGTWVYSYSSTLSSALGEYAKRIIEGQAKKHCLSDLEKAFQYYTPGVKWRCAAYVDPKTGIRADNYLLMYMDTHIFGGGTLNTTSLAISEKYRNISPQ